MKTVLCGILAFTLVAAGCSAKTGASGGSAPIGMTSPTITSNERPDFQLQGTRVNGTVMDLRIAVKIDSLGQPDLRTLQVTGVGAGQNRDAIARWIERSRFRPAQQGGRAVDGIFKTRFQVRAESRRVGGV